MKPGDLVIRKIHNLPDYALKEAVAQRDRNGHGIVLTTQMAGTPKHLCATVWYPKSGQTWDIAVALMEVISPCRGSA